MRSIARERERVVLKRCRFRTEISSERVIDVRMRAHRDRVQSAAAAVATSPFAKLRATFFDDDKQPEQTHAPRVY